MRAYKVLRQTEVVRSPCPARRGLLGASVLADHCLKGRQISFATTHAMAFSTNRANTIGFIGLGAMGHHMSGGGEVGFALCDVNQTVVQTVMKYHVAKHPSVPVVSCSSPYDVAHRASIIISMVPTGKHVQEVYLGEGKSVRDALKSMGQDQRVETLCIDQSTIEQSVSKSVALQLREVGADLVDAPVSGGVLGAEKGTLAVMVGGSKSSFNRAVPVLQSMARKVVYCGDLGAGLAAKISNNEAMLLGKRLGVDSQLLTDIINNSTGRCWSSEINHPVPDVKVGNSSPPAHRNYEGGFVTTLAHKDLALAISAANDADVPLVLGRCVEEAYRPLAKSKEFKDRDFSVIYKALAALGPSVSTSEL